MPLNASTVDKQLTDAFHAEADISAACQGILTTEIKPNGSHWYSALSQKLDALKAVAREWESQEQQQLKQRVLPAIIAGGEQFTDTGATINPLFDRAAKNPETEKTTLNVALEQLLTPANTINTRIIQYQKSLKSWRDQLRKAHNQMSTTVGEIQSREQDLAEKIQAVNSTISDLTEQIKNDKKLIAKARKEAGKKNVIKTIFGIILGAATGGVSSILAGMGVSSIDDAEKKVKKLQQSIEKYQVQLFKQHQDISEAQRELVSLKGLLIPANLAITDVQVAEQALDTVRSSWEQYHQELTGVITKVEKATDADMIIVQKAWFNAACKEWDTIISDAKESASSF